MGILRLLTLQSRGGDGLRILLYWVSRSNDKCTTRAQLVGRYPKLRVWSDRARSTSGPFHHAGHFTTRGMWVRLGLRELLPQQCEVTSYWAALLPRTSRNCPGQMPRPVEI